MKFRKINNRGFSHVELAIVVLVVAVLGLVGYRVLKNTSHAGSNCAGQTLRFDNQKIGYGSTGQCVSDLQVLTGAYLGAPIKVDGKYGPITKSSVISLQKKVFSNDSTQWDGVVGANTWSKICASVPKLQSKTVYNAQLDACGKTTFKLVAKSINPVSAPKPTSPIDSVNNLGIQNPDEITSDDAGNIYVLSHSISNGEYSYSISAINPSTRKLIKNYTIKSNQCWDANNMKIGINKIFLACDFSYVTQIQKNSGAQDILDLSNISCDYKNSYSFCSGNANTYVVKNDIIYTMGLKYNFVGSNSGVEAAFFGNNKLLFADDYNAMDIEEYNKISYMGLSRLSKDDLIFTNSYNGLFNGASYLCNEISKTCSTFKYDSSLNQISKTKSSYFLGTSYSSIAAIDFIGGTLGNVYVGDKVTYSGNIQLPILPESFTDNWVLGLDKSTGSQKLVNIVYPTQKVGNSYDTNNFNLARPVGMVQDTSRNLWILNDAVRDSNGSILKTAYLTEISESGKLLGTAR